MATKLILVGGFLGSGKTTLLWEAARRLTGQGHAVGLITNDQAPDLVDTALLSRSGVGVREVAGSCFCCNFDGLMGAVRSLMDRNADIIIAEPVGSCTDLSATIMQPLKDKHPEIGLAPLTVLADPDRVREVLKRTDSLIHPSALYILRLQMEEADCILLNKIDTLRTDEGRAMVELLRTSFPKSEVGEISARRGDGIDAWLASLLSAKEAGKTIVDVDYDRYAEGEAVLGWLNAVIDLQARTSQVDFMKPTRVLLDRLHKAFRERQSEIGHAKVVLETGSEERDMSLTRLDGTITGRDDSPLIGMGAKLTLNVRVQIPPEALEAIAGEEIAGLSDETVTASVRTLQCLMPGRPQPTYRYGQRI